MWNAETGAQRMLAALYAIEKGDRALLERFAKDLERATAEMKSRALVIAAGCGHEEIVRFLLRFCKVSAPAKAYYLKKFTSLKELSKSLPLDVSPLFLAAIAGKLSIIDVLIKAGAPALTHNEQKCLGARAVNSPQVTAAFKALLDAHKLVETSDYSDTLAALEHKNEVLFQCCMRILAKKDPLLFELAKKNDTALVEKVAAFCPTRERAARIVFEGACAGKHYEVVRTLAVQDSVQLDEKGCVIRSTPLWYASGEGDIQLVRLLLSLGAAVDTPSFIPDASSVISLTTPFLRAWSQKKFDVAELLLERGADINARAKIVQIQGNVPIALEQQGNSALVPMYDTTEAQRIKFLIDHGIRLSKPNPDISAPNLFGFSAETNQVIANAWQERKEAFFKACKAARQCRNLYKDSKPVQ